MVCRGLIAIVLCAAVGCRSVGSEFAGEPWQTAFGEAEALAGRRVAPQLEHRFGGVVADARAVARLERIVARLAPAGASKSDCYHVRILGSERVNAFSLPGRLIYVTRGLLSRVGEDENLLAATLAHEMAHLAARDSLRPDRGNRSAEIDREIAADRMAVSLLRGAGFDEDAMRRLVRMVADCQHAAMVEARLSALP